MDQKDLARRVHGTLQPCVPPAIRDTPNEPRLGCSPNLQLREASCIHRLKVPRQLFVCIPKPHELDNYPIWGHQLPY